VAISQQRGYITGNQYILEKVILSMVMAIIICLNQTAPTCSQLTVKQVILLGMLPVILML
jgi:hypothetical protein